jgi:transcriptional regulator with XRE-family HTH domain
MTVPEPVPPADQVANLLGLLRRMVGLCGASNRGVEEKLGVSYGYLSRLFAGAIELKARHVFEICEVLGVDPAELFQVAYPLPPRTRALGKLREIAGLPAPQSSPSREEIEKLVREILRSAQEDGSASG